MLKRGETVSEREEREEREEEEEERERDRERQRETEREKRGGGSSQGFAVKVRTSIGMVLGGHPSWRHMTMAEAAAGKRPYSKTNACSEEVAPRDIAMRRMTTGSKITFKTTIARGMTTLPNEFMAFQLPTSDMPPMMSTTGEKASPIADVG